MEYVTKNHSKFPLMYHLIFVIKYRKKIIDRFLAKDILQKISEGQNFSILKMETNEDHVHLLIQSEPKISPLRIVKTLKGSSTILL